MALKKTTKKEPAEKAPKLCPVCNGTGRDAPEQTCPACNGTGKEN